MTAEIDKIRERDAQMTEHIRSNGLLDSKYSALVDMMGKHDVRTLLKEIDRLTAELAESEKAEEALDQKLTSLVGFRRDGDGMATCGCSYDSPDDVCMCHSPKLKAALAQNTALREALEPLVKFASSGVEYAWDGGDWEGGDIQELAEELGIVTAVRATKPCSDNCRCAEWDDFPQTCYRLSEWFVALEAAHEASEETP